MTPLSDLHEEVTPEQARELHEADAVQLVDVREQNEWDAGRIAGATHIPVAELSDRAPSLDADKPVVFYCQSGSRSAMATQAFRASGFDAHNLTGGIAAWDSQGLPLEPEDASVVNHQ
jgi:rhodanese-related sulfurtransferase